MRVKLKTTTGYIIVEAISVEDRGDYSFDIVTAKDTYRVTVDEPSDAIYDLLTKGWKDLYTYTAFKV